MWKYSWCWKILVGKLSSVDKVWFGRKALEWWKFSKQSKSFKTLKIIGWKIYRAHETSHTINKLSKTDKFWLRSSWEMTNFQFVKIWTFKFFEPSKSSQALKNYDSKSFGALKIFILWKYSRKTILQTIKKLSKARKFRVTVFSEKSFFK